MKKAGFAPLYCALYPDLAECVRSHGYALAIHGSLARDFDLIAIPWIDSPSPSGEVVADLEKRFDLTALGKVNTREHGRQVYTMRISRGHCYLDLSFMPIKAARLTRLPSAKENAALTSEKMASGRLIG